MRINSAHCLWWFELMVLVWAIHIIPFFLNNAFICETTALRRLQFNNLLFREQYRPMLKCYRKYLVLYYSECNGTTHSMSIRIWILARWNPSFIFELLLAVWVRLDWWTHKPIRFCWLSSLVCSLQWIYFIDIRKIPIISHVWWWLPVFFYSCFTVFWSIFFIFRFRDRLSKRWKWPVFIHDFERQLALTIT